ncbi:MAG: choice-of-anchor D domain-containing protein [Nitrospirae bacterium]|nr:choice-of-anchor D domain-containing protein [Nitrospirota bacterium]
MVSGVISNTAVVLSDTNDADTANNTVAENTTIHYRLLVTIDGNGTGIVTSVPTGTGIDCGADCEETFMPETTMTLTAVPDALSIFSGWSGGGCSGVAECIIIVNGDISVNATFIEDETDPVTTPAPSDGQFVSSVFVTLTCADFETGCDKTYYCVGIGCTPTTEYTGVPIRITSTDVLRFYSLDNAGNDEGVVTKTFTETGQMARNSYYRQNDLWLITAYTVLDPAANSYVIYIEILDAITHALVNREKISLLSNPWLAISNAGRADITFIYDEASGTGYLIYYDSLGNEQFVQVPDILPTRPSSLLIAPKTVDMGVTSEGKMTSATATISNGGGADLSITSITPPSSPFSLSGGTCSTLLPLPSGGSCTLGIRFSPKAVGEYTGEIKIYSTGGDVVIGLVGAAR